MGRGRGELVRLADDERVEAVALIERRRRGGARGRDGSAAVGGDEEVHLRALLPFFLHAEDHLRRSAEHALGRAREHRRVLALVPLGSELVGRAEDEAILVERDRHSRLEPGPHCRVGKFAPCLFEEALPGFFR